MSISFWLMDFLKVDTKFYQISQHLSVSYHVYILGPLMCHPQNNHSTLGFLFKMQNLGWSSGRGVELGGCCWKYYICRLFPQEICRLVVMTSEHMTAFFPLHLWREMLFRIPISLSHPLTLPNASGPSYPGAILGLQREQGKASLTWETHLPSTLP